MKTRFFPHGKLGMTLAGVAAFYFLALAGTFAVVWLNAAHTTQANSSTAS